METRVAEYAEQERELRIVLVGKTGAGKSAVGSTILGRKAFKSVPGISSVTSECQKETGEFEGQKLAVVDTPGLYDTTVPQAEVITEITRCISFAAPGPHVFLVVISINRFTEEEQKTVKIIQNIFGEAAAHYMMVLFTRGDDLEADGVSIEEVIRGNKALRDFLRRCGGRYQLFNNRDKDPSQVRKLLKKINSMILINGGSYYTTEMFREAEKAIEEEEKKLLKKNPNMTPGDARKEAEKDNKFISDGKLVAISAGAGAAALGVGAGIGAAAATGASAAGVAGPVGAVVGGLVGTLVGCVTVLVRDVCVIQ